MGGLPSQGGGGPQPVRRVKISDQPIDVKITDEPIDVKITDEPIDVKISDQPIDVNILNTIDADITDRCSRLLGQLCFGGVAIDPRDRDWTLDFVTDQVDISGSSVDVTDRAARLLGIVFGSQSQQLQQRAATFELLVQLTNAGVQIDPRDRNWTLDFATDQVDVSGSTVTIGALIQFTPIEKAVIHDQAMPAANTNILGADITPTNTPTTFRIMVSISVAAKFSATITRAATTKTSKFNGGADLVTDTLFIFDLLVHSGDSINFQFSATGGTINDLRLQEIDSATA